MKPSEALNPVQDEKTLAERPRHRPLLRRVALLEIVLFLGGALVVDQLFFDGSRFLSVEPHPFWILVVLLSVQYGSRMGLVAALACTVTLLYGNVPERSFAQDIHDWLLSIMELPFLCGVSAVVIGELCSRRITARHQMNNALLAASERESALVDSLHQLNTIKERMEMRVAGQWRTVSKTLNAARAIEEMEPKQVLSQSLELVEHMLGPEHFSIFLLKNNTLHHTFNWGWTPQAEYSQFFKPETPLFSAVIGERRIVCVSNPADEGILDRQGVLAGPLVVPETDVLLGMLKVEKMTFDQLSLSTVKNFEFLCEWIGSLYSKALDYQQYGYPDQKNTASPFHNGLYFPVYNKFLIDLANQAGFSLVLLKVRVHDYPMLPNALKSRFKIVLDQSLKKVLRADDLMLFTDLGLGKFTVLLPNISDQYRKMIKPRLQAMVNEQLGPLPAAIDYELEIYPLTSSMSALHAQSSS